MSLLYGRCPFFFLLHTGWSSCIYKQVGLGHITAADTCIASLVVVKCYIETDTAQVLKADALTFWQRLFCCKVHFAAYIGTICSYQSWSSILIINPGSGTPRIRHRVAPSQSVPSVVGTVHTSKPTLCARDFYRPYPRCHGICWWNALQCKTFLIRLEVHLTQLQCLGFRLQLSHRPPTILALLSPKY